MRVKYAKWLAFAAVLLAVQGTWADVGDDDQGKKYGHSYVPGGPNKNYLYTNDRGAFEIKQGGQQGSAKYKWFDNTTHNDTLTFYKQAEIKRPGNVVHRGYIYEGADNNGGKWYLFFGYESFGVVNGKQVFPVYYTFDDIKANPNNQSFQRFLTPSGTGRIELP